MGNSDARQGCPTLTRCLQWQVRGIPKKPLLHAQRLRGTARGDVRRTTVHAISFKSPDPHSCYRIFLSRNFGSSKVPGRSSARSKGVSALEELDPLTTKDDNPSKSLQRIEISMSKKRRKRIQTSQRIPRAPLRRPAGTDSEGVSEDTLAMRINTRRPQSIHPRSPHSEPTGESSLLEIDADRR